MEYEQKKVYAANLEAGGTGLNLTGVDVVIHNVEGAINIPLISFRISRSVVFV